MSPGTVISLIPETISVLFEIAQAKETITYEGLANRIGSYPWVTPLILKPIQEICIEKDYPPLTSLVVNKKTGWPGEAFFDPWLPRDEPKNLRKKMWLDMLEEVYAFPWATVNI